MNLWSSLFLILGILLTVGGAAVWSYNWWKDWQTRLERRLPSPPLGTVWELQQVWDHDYYGYTVKLHVYDVILESSTRVDEFWTLVNPPKQYQIKRLVTAARHEVDRRDPIDRVQSRFLTR